MPKPKAKAKKKPVRKLKPRNLEPAWSEPTNPVPVVAPFVLVPVPIEKTKDPAWLRWLHWIFG